MDNIIYQELDVTKIKAWVVDPHRITIYPVEDMQVFNQNQSKVVQLGDTDRFPINYRVIDNEYIFTNIDEALKKLKAIYFCQSHPDIEINRARDIAAVQVKIGDISGYEGASFRKHDKPCPGCGQETIYCCHCDMGFTDYYDNFWHVCINPKCDYVEHEEHYTGSGCESDGDLDCPFCKKSH